ncbi:MAG TPA: pilus assembly protein TadG-related protein [Bauldia sp.]|nr:pilus assembly protein TadG-related protein [Bauldia sp.]
MMWIQFLRDRRASVAPIFAITLVPMLIATGAAIDFSRAFRQRTVIQDALDAAALAAGKRLGAWTDDKVKTEAQNFYTTNVGGKVDIKPTMTPTITNNQPTLTLTTQLHVPTYFLGLIGVREFVFNLTAQTTQGMGTLEVAFALDNSTSMTLPSTKISTLKTAASDLATTLWGLASTSTKPDPVKIAVVPFGGAVNIGASTALANGWVDTAGKGTYAADSMKDSALLGSGNTAAASFNPYSLFSTLKDSSGNAISWAGCVEERPAPYDVSDDAPTSSTNPTAEEAKTLFEPMVAPDEPDNWNCSTSSCDYIGSSSSTRRYNGTPTGSQTYNNYLPDAGDATTCGTITNTLSSITAATPAVFNKTSHGLTADTALIFGTTGSLPSGITAGSTYYVSPAGLTSSAFRVAATTTGTNFTVSADWQTVTISNATPAVFTDTSHGLTIGTQLTLSTTGTLPGSLSNSTTYYVATVPSTSTFTVTTASSGSTVTFSGSTITRNGHGLSAGTALAFKTTNTLPSPLSANTTYYVLSNPATNTFKVSTTTNGTAVSLSGGSGTLSYVVLQKTTSAGSGTHSYVVNGAASIFTSSNHGLSNGDAIAVDSTGSLPSPLSGATVYYVVNKTTNTFNLATTSGGTGINVTGSSSGTLSFVKLLAGGSGQSGTHSYYTNALSYTCANGDCSGGVSGRTEKQAFGGKSVTGSELCKYGTTTNKGTVASITVANLSGVGSFGPNFGCSTTAITPLTTSQNTISTAITAMQANGYTNITGGLMWAWRVLSPGAPFTDGRASTDTENQKIIVLMTDGENTYNPYLQADQDPSTSSTAAGKFVKSAYGAWGYIAENHLGTTANTSQPIMDKLNARLAAACTAAKAANIRVYTVGFEINSTTASDPATTKALLQNCATQTNMYYDAQNESDLTAAFTAIGDSISLLRLSQ